jgi:hypothetical protein
MDVMNPKYGTGIHYLNWSLTRTSLSALLSSFRATYRPLMMANLEQRNAKHSPCQRELGRENLTGGILWQIFAVGSSIIACSPSTISPASAGIRAIEATKVCGIR